MLITGARVFLYINAVKIGRARSFTWKSDTEADEIPGLDSSDPYEIAPTTTRCAGQIMFYRTAGDGGAEGAGLTTDYEDLTRLKYVTLSLVERVSKLEIFRAEGVTITSQSGGVAAKEGMNMSITFKALRYSNEFKKRD